MLSHLISKTWLRFILAALSSVIFGSISVSLIALINEIIHAQPIERSQLFILFAVLAISGVIVQLLSKIVSEQLSETSQAELRKLVAQKTIDAKLDHIERQGAAKIKSCLTEHSLKVAGFFTALPGILTNAVIVLGAFVYMAILDWRVFIFALLTLVLGSLGYSLANAFAFKKLSDAADMQDNVYLQFDAITDGAKELKLHREKRYFFRDKVLSPAIDAMCKKRIQGATIFHYASSWGGFTVFAFIGGALFFLTGQTEDNNLKAMSGFAFAFIYMLTPLEALLGSIPIAAAAKVSGDVIEEITAQLDQESVGALQVYDSFRKLELCGLSHSYYHEQSDEIFSLKPISVTLNAGELIYLVGGNGSGKTTFAKVMCGLYEANEGEIKVDGNHIGEHNLDDYRQLFTTIFGDYHLFDRILTVSDPQLESRGNALIKKLNLHHKVQIKDGAFTTQSLSQGQRKRLALVVAYLENRPFYLFDEWAADQDPIFKKVFYTELLPELKAQGKTVFVITHDDKYFGYADRLLKMESGQLSETNLNSVNQVAV